MKRSLAYSQMPGADVPLRFLLGAPWMGVLAGLLLAWSPTVLLQSHLAGAALAVTHLLVLGFLGSCMLGALLQILPVVCGVTLAHCAGWSRRIHRALLAGTLTLAAAFLWPRPWLFMLAPALLALAFLPFLALVVRGFARAGCAGDDASTRAIALALVSLAIAIGLGASMALGLGGVFDALPILRLMRLHVGWGAIGWVLLLVMGVAFQVIPMFQATPSYAPRYTRFVPALLFALLCLSWFGRPGQALDVAISVVVASFAAVTFYLLARRKRPRADPTTLYWRLAMPGLLACLPAFFMDAQLLAGSLFLAGFAVPATTGMLVRIVPFLVWYHAQARMGTGDGRKPPSISAYLDEAGARRQFIAYGFSLLAWITACILWEAGLGTLATLAGRIAGVGLALSFAWLGWILLGAMRVDRRALAAEPVRTPRCAAAPDRGW